MATPTQDQEAVLSPTRSVNGVLPGTSSGQVIRLLNSIVDVCLVYGFDETCMRELEAEEGVSGWVGGVGGCGHITPVYLCMYT